jgi:glycine/D-amino acid oxidase-like deaminating enzyme/nitrite reductase/ring-hydroxylating ferredoxin subunit
MEGQRVSEAHSTTNISYWVDSTAASEHPSLEGTVDVEVAIVGAGIVGLTAARLLKRSGKTVAVIEMDRMVRGVTGYTTAKITSGHSLIYQQLENKHGEDVARVYAMANQDALEKMSGWIEEEAIACDFERRPNFVYSDRNASKTSIEKEADAARRAGLDVSLVTDADLPFEIAAAVRLDNQAQFHPRKYLLHFGRDIVGDGSHIFENSRVVDISEGDRCVVKTGAGTVIANHVVLATHYPFWDRGLLFPRVHPKRSYVIAGPVGEASVPDGMYISVDQPTRSIRTIRDADRTLLMVGGNGHGTGQKYDTENEYKDLERWMSHRFGVSQVTYRWSTHDGVAVDLLPYAGTARRGTDRIYTATGFGKWGMTNGTAAAMVISDAILGVPNEFAPLFDPHRLTIRASASKLVSENTKVAWHWLSDRVKHPQEGAFEGLEPGQTAVKGVAPKQVAGYRDEEGRLHTVSATCTHLGCIVAWNEAEKSWDCPCHGSRFDPDGRVLHGPAVRDLQPRAP